jgi:hypothetical protein
MFSSSAAYGSVAFCNPPSGELSNVILDTRDFGDL